MNTKSLGLALTLFIFFNACCHQSVKLNNGWTKNEDFGKHVIANDLGGNGIEVGEPQVYDDTALRMLLDKAKDRLASINGLNEAALTTRLGAVTGARIDQSQFGLQVTGPSNPGAAAAAAITPPASPSIPSGLSFTPPSTFSVSSLDALNEEMQLTNEISGLQLLLEGALSDRFIRNERFIKPRATIGFSITIEPLLRFKNAVAVIEVSVMNSPSTLSDEPPSITALLPEEKTYNVAALTDRTTSIGSGAVIGTVGASGTFFSAHRTFYLVRDQDTVAVQRPSAPNETSFAWEFRPVLGRQYVSGGRRHTFVQLAFPSIEKGCIGTIRVRTYWRYFDQKSGLAEDLVEGSVFQRDELFAIPKYDLTPFVKDINFQDLGDGTVIVHVKGNFLSGTYVQIGPNHYDLSSGLQIEGTGLTFTVPASALAQWTGHVISRDGDRANLLDVSVQDLLPPLDQLSCVKPPPNISPQVQIRNIAVSPDGKAVDIFLQKDSETKTPASIGLADRGARTTIGITSAALIGVGTKSPVLRATIIPDPSASCGSGFITIREVYSEILNETASEVTIKLDFDILDEAQFNHEILLDIGHKIFGLGETTVKKNFREKIIKAIVPTSLLVAGGPLRVFRPFFTSPEGSLAEANRNTCYNKFHNFKFGLDSTVDRLVLIEVDKAGNAHFLLYGNDLRHVEVVPKGKGKLSAVGGLRQDRVRLLTIGKDDLPTLKKLVLQKNKDSRPIVLDLPQPETKPEAKPEMPPKVTLDSPVVQNTDELDVSVERVDDLVSVKMGEKTLMFTPKKDSIHLTNLSKAGVTSEQKTRELTFTYKDNTKVTAKLNVVAARISVEQ